MFEHPRLSEFDGITRDYYTSTYESGRRELSHIDIRNIFQICDPFGGDAQKTSTATSDFSMLSGVERWNSNKWISSNINKGRYELASSPQKDSKPISIRRQRSVAEQISMIRMRKDLPMAREPSERLEYLDEISKEEFPEQEPMSSRSLEDLLVLIEHVPGIAYPDLVLTYEGNIRAEWTKSRNKHFAIEFFGGDGHRFVLFAPDPVKPTAINRISGISTLNRLLDLMAPMTQWTG